MKLGRHLMARSSFRAVTAACLGIVLYASFAAAAPDKPPPPRHEYTNVILISLQCLRPDHLGIYGYQKETSKHMDSLARKSVIFDNAISQANLTPVAQMSVLTSQYPRLNGMVSFEVTRDMVKARTLPEVLKYYGYTTAATLSSPEFFMRFDTESGGMINPGDVFSRSFDYYGRTARGPQGGSLRTAPTDAFQWLKNNKDNKFFLWIGSGLLHMPYATTVPAPFKTMYDPPNYTPFWKRLPGQAGSSWTDEPSYDVFSRVYRDQFYWGFKPVYRLTEDDRRYVNGRYDAGVFYTDLFIGELMDLLEKLDLTQKTLVVLQSMHGDDLGENGQYFHYDITDRVVKNALIIHFPKDQFGGKRVGEQVQGLDVMPTILSYLDIPVPHEAQGSDLIPLIRGDAGATGTDAVYIDRLPWWEYTLSKWYLELQDASGGQLAPEEEAALKQYRQLLQTSFDKLGYPPGDIAVRTKDWKLVVRKNHEVLEKVSWWVFITGTRQPVEEIELYDLKKDPDERRNVAKDHPEVVARLKAGLISWDQKTEEHKATYIKNDKRYLIPYP